MGSARHARRRTYVGAEGGISDHQDSRLAQAPTDPEPALYSQENEADPEIPVKFFNPQGSWTWYAIEFDGDDTFFGYVDGEYPELGYFSLAELSEYKGPFGIGIERDRYWDPSTRLSKVKR